MSTCPHWRRRLALVAAFVATAAVAACTDHAPGGEVGTSGASAEATSRDPAPTTPPVPATARGSGDPRSPSGAATNAGKDVTAIVDARVFDGVDVHEQATVVFSTDEILAVGDVAAPPGATIIDGDGLTVLPGLLDAHHHTIDEVALERAAAFGVTTVLDMFTEPTFARRMRQEQQEGEATGRAELYSAGWLATAPAGHGTQFGVTVPPVTGPDMARGWVVARAGEGSDWIKVVVEPSGADDPLPTLDAAAVQVLVDEAHEIGLLTVAHVSRAQDAAMVIEQGIDGLAHVWLNDADPDELVRTIVDRAVFVIPTLSVYDAGDPTIGEQLVDDPALAPLLTDDEVEALRSALTRDTTWIANGLAAVSNLHQAGAVVLAGTDASNPGVVPGASLHGELTMLVEAGLTPVEALAAATSVPAATFDLDDRGVVAPGRRADLLIVAGDPTVDVAASRAIRRVFIDGVELER